MNGPATMTEYRLSGGMPERMTPQREIAMEALEGEQATIRELAEIAGVSEGVLRGLVKDWPAVEAGRKSGEALVDSLARRGRAAIPCEQTGQHISGHDHQ